VEGGREGEEGREGGRVSCRAGGRRRRRSFVSLPVIGKREERRGRLPLAVLRETHMPPSLPSPIYPLRRDPSPVATATSAVGLLLLVCLLGVGDAFSFFSLASSPRQVRSCLCV